MAVVQEGSNIVVNASIAGSVFPATERELVFPVLVDGSNRAVHVEGAVYGRSLELRGNVRVDGPVVARGDTRLRPMGGQIQLRSGLTVNGSLNCVLDGAGGSSILDRIQDASVIIRGDLAVNQNIVLKNTIVFGSLRAVNCSLENSLVLGTCLVNESLTVSMSSIGGYATRDVTFSGDCLMLHALGESLTQPIFVPYERGDGKIIESDLRYYPAIRSVSAIMNRRSTLSAVYPNYSRLYPETDWVRADVTANPALNEDQEGPLSKWILSLGGRICDISKISQAVVSLTRMLKCGFEYEHYHPARRGEYLKQSTHDLTDEERWTLETLCA